MNSDAQGTLRTLKYRPDIDGLRGVAALAVLGIHISPIVAGGRAGVDIFFVISGFLISGIILRSLAREDFSYVDFYSRRVRRIFPALILVMLSSWAAGSLILLPDEYRSLGSDMVAGSFFFLNISRYISFLQPEPGLQSAHDLGTSFSNHLWSLGIEEQFYVLWPVFLVAIWKLSKGRIGFIAPAILVTAVTSLVFFLILDPIPSRNTTLLPWVRLWELAAGGLLACMHVSKVRVANNPLDAFQNKLKPSRLSSYSRSAHHLLGFIGTGLIAASIASDPFNDAIPGAWALFPVIGAYLLISAGPQSWVNQYVLASRPMVFVGLISYPIYLWHLPIFAVYNATTQVTPLGLASLVLLTFALSYLTYRYVELPVRHSARTLTVVGRTVVLMMLCALIGVLAQLQIIHPRTHSDAFAQAASEDWLTQSMNGSWTKFPGILTLGDGQQRTLFWGDSALQQYYPRIDEVLAKSPPMHRSAVFATRFGCAPIVSRIVNVREEYRVACDAHTKRAAELAEDSRVDTIVIGACWPAYFVDFELLGRPVAATGVDEALAELKQMIHAYAARGKTIYVVLSTPYGRSLDPREFVPRAGQFRKNDPWTLQPAAPPVSGEIAERIMVRLRRLAEQAGAIVIDPLDYLCEENGCQPAIWSLGPIYRDEWHLRPSYARTHIKFIDRTVAVTRSQRDALSSDAR